MTQQQLLDKTKEKQHAFIKQQLERRDKTRVLLEGLTKENGKPMERVHDLGLVKRSIMKHQISKQKLQYYDEIRKENNELRYENQVLEIHGDSFY